MNQPTPFSFVVIILLTAIVCASVLVGIHAMPPDTLEKMLLLIVGGALGALNMSAHPQQPASETIPVERISKP
jgi:hypothetical protein